MLKTFNKIILSSFFISISINAMAIPLSEEELQLQRQEKRQQYLDNEREEVRVFEQNYQNHLATKGMWSDLASSKVLENVFNFDVVVNNQNFLIYRSSLLGSYGLEKLASYLKKENLAFPKTIVYMNKQGYNSIVPPVIGDFAIEEHADQKKYNYNFFHSFDYNYRTYVDGDNPYEPSEDIDAQTYYLFGMRARTLFPSTGPLEEKDGGLGNFIRVMETVLNPDNQPVLFHCFGGRHRTGMVGMAIRYLQGDQWVNGEKRDISLDGKVITLNPAQYEYYEHNKTMVREENFAFIERFSLDPAFIKLKERYSKLLNE